MKKIEKIAYHESGHAVAAYIIGKEVQHLTIIPKGSALGSSESELSFGADFDLDHFSIRKIDDHLTFFKLIVEYLAGYFADKIASRKGSRIGSGADIRYIEELAMKFGIPADLKMALFKHAELYTIEIFHTKEVWELVQALAEELLKKKELNRIEIAEIIKNSGCNDVYNREEAIEFLRNATIVED
jgi:hypothetical protein